jgi:flagellar basal-body rod protein FlgF
MNALFLAASGAESQLAGLGVAASNLANLATPGFRRLLNVVQSVSGHGSAFEFAASDATPPLDMAQGPISATGNPLDVALTGPAFIAVQTPQGPAYTRNGELQLAPDGTLLAADQPVLGAGGAPLRLPAGPISIASDGSVSVAGTPAGRIALADPSGVTMVPLGGGLYKPADDSTLPPAVGSASQVHQGSLETSAGSAVGEMVALMNASRNYEAAMNSVKSIDQNSDRAAQAFTLTA